MPSSFGWVEPDRSPRQQQSKSKSDYTTTTAYAAGAGYYQGSSPAVVDDLRNIPVAYGTPMMPAPPLFPPQHERRAADAVAADVNINNTAFIQPLSDSARRLLQEQGFTNGLIESLVLNQHAFPVTFWVVDNSGSMAQADGHRIVALTAGRQPPQHAASTTTYKFVDCTRWREMQETVDYHSQLATVLQRPTTFQLLNPPSAAVANCPQTFRVGYDPTSRDPDLATAQSVMMNTQPGGVTPLTQRIQDIRTRILTDPSLQRTLYGEGGSAGAQMAIVLATDGLPTDAQGNTNAFVRQQFVDTLRSLQGLPVWIVVRLCTDEDDVVQYWNELDGQLELSLEVLDDFNAEAHEVYAKNPWLNYCLPLHRMREMGFYHKLFDHLDERPLSKSELKDFMKILFGASVVVETMPDPEDDWTTFCDRVATLSRKESKQWNPLSKRLEPWINMKQLRRKYGSRGFFRAMW